MPTSASAQLAQQAKFIFRGTVQKLKDATLPAVPVTDRTIIVRVDEIIQAPEALSYCLGENITVLLNESEKVKKGEQAIFYTNSWMVGESIAVQSLGHEPVTGRASKASPYSSAESEPGRGLRQQLDEADLVVRGKVTSVRVIDLAGVEKATKDSSTRISEHTPIWHEAVIDVEDVEKGPASHKQVVVQFPSSTDVRWHQAPKFRPGQEGIFLLHKGEKEQRVSPELKAQRGGKKKKEAAYSYVALDPEDFQPIQNLETIRTLIKASST